MNGDRVIVPKDHWVIGVLPERDAIRVDGNYYELYPERQAVLLIRQCNIRLPLEKDWSGGYSFPAFEVEDKNGKRFTTYGRFLSTKALSPLRILAEEA